MKEKLSKIKSGNIEERNNLLIELMPIIESISRRLSSSRFEYEELVQIGVISVIEAFDKYDINKETSFTSYAAKNIYFGISNFLLKNEKIESFPYQYLHYCKNIVKLIEEENICDFTDEEVEYLKGNVIFSRDMLFDILKLSLDNISIDNEYLKSENCDIYKASDLCNNDKISAMEDDIVLEKVFELVSKKRTGSKRNIELFQKFFGFGYEKTTLEDLGREYNLSYQGVQSNIFRIKALMIENPKIREMLDLGTLEEAKNRSSMPEYFYSKKRVKKPKKGV